MDLDAYYDSIQARWPIEEESEYAALVVPNGNGGTPVHRWFRMKEAYSCDFVGRVLADAGLLHQDQIAVCDPFCGSGTTAVSLAEVVAEGRIQAAQFTGLETNPFLALVASAKLEAISSGCPAFYPLAQRVAARVARGGVAPGEPPSLSTFGQERYFAANDIAELLALKVAIRDEERADSDPLALKLARLCLASAVEPVSKLRRDGRALRYEPRKPTARPLTVFLARAAEIDDDLNEDLRGVSGAVHRNDARMATATLRGAGPFDLFVFSPPYPNNIDYTEVYKLEAWLLEEYADQAAFTNQRWRTIRSHASLDFGGAAVGLAEPLIRETLLLIQPLLDAAADRGGRYSAARQRTIQGYALDMLTTLVNLRQAATDDAHLVYAVGNSFHGGRDEDGVVIAADLLIGRLAELAGFGIDRLVVARRPSRRRSLSPYLRETVVFARSQQAPPTMANA